ncbi:hypothetical protein [Paractinoplanes atraurantiacus]|uniref:Uncharacterized protein n=1 Tax=Paractinoplanes atraurantiacus TaxID=1036182 RepID=A0A285KN71_9ACTN|nr:hypothetical protein [Actinoplanes atraurantiacus]SNY72826.1 hypothetical protein SAMN05421748_14424 [Actinoplanes atraurantiacus]
MFDSAQLLTRHRRQVAALINPLDLLGRPEPAERLAAEDLLRAGHRLEITVELGRPGRAGEYGVVEEPVGERFQVTAIDHRGRTVAEADGASIAETLLRLAPPAGEYVTEAPF